MIIFPETNMRYWNKVLYQMFKLDLYQDFGDTNFGRKVKMSKGKNVEKGKCRKIKMSKGKNVERLKYRRSN